MSSWTWSSFMTIRYYCQMSTITTLVSGLEVDLFHFRCPQNPAFLFFIFWFHVNYVAISKICENHSGRHWDSQKKPASQIAKSVMEDTAHITFSCLKSSSGSIIQAGRLAVVGRYRMIALSFEEGKNSANVRKVKLGNPSVKKPKKQKNLSFFGSLSQYSNLRSLWTKCASMRINLVILAMKGIFCLFLFFKNLLTLHRHLWKVFYLEIVLLTQYVMHLVFLSSSDFISGH